MKLNELVPSSSKYLAKEDVGENGRNLTIKGFKRERVRGDSGDEDKAVMFFEENVKPMILNKTNMNRLSNVLKANDTSECKGRVINVFNDPLVEFGGKITGGIRVRAKVEGADPVSADEDDFDESIPF